MNEIVSFIQAVAVFLAAVAAPVTRAVLPVNHVSQTATPSSELRRVLPSPTVFTPAPQSNVDKVKEKLVSEDVIRAEDYFDYMNQTVTFYIDIPKKGGKISGKITGLCNGEVSFLNKRVVLTADVEKPIQTRAYPVMRIW